jgi:hypothetical protein
MLASEEQGPATDPREPVACPFAGSHPETWSKMQALTPGRACVSGASAHIATLICRSGNPLVTDLSYFPCHAAVP